MYYRSKVVGVELSCSGCDYEERHEDELDLAPDFGHDRKCPKCGKGFYRFPFVVCHCGRTVYLQNGDTECDCGQAYNAFGDKITHMGFTEDDY